MKKLLLIILCLFTFNNVFASSQPSKPIYTDRVYGGIMGAFDYLIKTRNKGSSDPAIAARRQKAENLLLGSMRQGYRNQVVTAYQEEETGFKQCLELDKKSGNQNEIKMSSECLNELTRIRNIIGIK